MRASGSMPTDGMDSIQKAPEHVTGHGGGSSGPFLRFQHCPQNLVHRRAQSQPRGQGAAEAGRGAPPITGQQGEQEVESEHRRSARDMAPRGERGAPSGASAGCRG